MSYEFPPDIRALVDRNLAIGGYTTDDQVLEAALNALSDYHQTISDLREGMKDYADGRSQPLEEAFQDVRSQLGFDK